MANEKFDPTKTREEQGLDPLPAWLFSEPKFRKMLKDKGLRETSPNAEGWTTLEAIPRKPMFPPEKGSRMDNPYPAVAGLLENGQPNERMVTEREQKAYLAHFAAIRKAISEDRVVRV